MIFRRHFLFAKSLAKNGESGASHILELGAATARWRGAHPDAWTLDFIPIISKIEHRFLSCTATTSASHPPVRAKVHASSRDHPTVVIGDCSSSSSSFRWHCPQCQRRRRRRRRRRWGRRPHATRGGVPVIPPLRRRRRRRYPSTMGERR
jgi:hypothetical protein